MTTFLSSTPSRRQFLRATVGSTAVLALGSRAPAFLLHAAQEAAGATTGPAANDEAVLVVVQLSGGNDGLNTIVPYTDAAYKKARPTLAVSANDVLKINDRLGFHPSLRGFADLLESQRLAIIQGVGYPEPNRSHFESMDIWHTCQPKTKQRTDGWLGRALDGAARRDKDRQADSAAQDPAGPSAASDLPAVHLGAQKQPLALAARNVRVPSISSLERFRLQAGNSELLKAAAKELASTERPGDNDLLGFVQSSTSAALAASERIELASRQYKTDVTYPETGLAGKLRLIAQLIDAGMKTRIYYVELDGFDTHSQQAGAHAALLREWSGAVAAFIQDVVAHGHGERVMVVGFSEFGRRVAENASQGTDHGAAAPMFLAGVRVKGGVHGEMPSLADLDDGDQKHHTDFRRVYATLLENWLHWPSAPALGDRYDSLDLIT